MILKDSFKKDEIPKWIIYLSIVVIIILTIKTISALFVPKLIYGEIINSIEVQKVLWELAGRNIAMLAATLIAVRVKNSNLFILIMILNIFRESFDMFIIIRFSNGELIQLLQSLSFLLFIIPYFIAIKKLSKVHRIGENKTTL